MQWTGNLINNFKDNIAVLSTNRTVIRMYDALVYQFILCPLFPQLNFSTAIYFLKTIVTYGNSYSNFELH